MKTDFLLGILRLSRRNFLASLDREFLVIQLVLPLFFIFVAGFGYSLIVPSVSGISYETFLATGAVAMTVMSSSMLSGTMVWFDRDSGMFEQIMMGPFTRFQYVISIVLTVALTGLINSLLVFLVSLTVSRGIVLSTLSIAELIAALLVGSLFFGGLGVFVSLRLRSSEALAAMMNLVFFIFAFLSSVFYPSYSSFLPLRIVFQLNPLTYLADLVRNAMVGLPGFNITVEAVVLIGECLAMIFLGSKSIYGMDL